MKSIFKLSAIIVVFVMLFSLVSCSEKPTVQEWVAENGAEKEAEYAQSLGDAYTVEVLANGYDVVIKMYMIGADNVSDEGKAIIQKSFDDDKDFWSYEFEQLKDEIDGIQHVVYQVCEEDGDLIVEFATGK